MRGARALQIPEPVIGEPAFHVGQLEVGLKTDDFGVSRNRLLISASHIERPAEQGMALASERVEHDGALGETSWAAASELPRHTMRRIVPVGGVIRKMPQWADKLLISAPTFHGRLDDLLPHLPAAKGPHNALVCLKVKAALVPR